MNPTSSSSSATNRLIHQTSPYLLQHAHNPVDWFPWGDEALEKAKKEDKPIIVSIGYSACHWCHVMEKESFEEEEVARLMNASFVNIKVDREERPDVDQIYMEAVQTMGAQGGWPLNVFLTPDQKPFYGGTYFPRENWMTLLQNVAMAFKNSRPQLEESAEQFALNLAASEIQRYGIDQSPEDFQKESLKQELEEVYEKFSSRFDQEKGGMSGSPKFPMPCSWLFLLRYYAMTKNEEALSQIALTLDKMASGGIYDQIGGGFARYSVDDQWFAPHFEKMLYDNGQLLSLYAEAYALTKNPVYRAVMEETAAFVSRELTSEEGGFYSALDADSEGEEGKFYVWQYEELQDLLGEKGDLILEYYGVGQEGNWENGHNILYRPLSDEDFAEQHHLGNEALKAMVSAAKETLFKARARRIRPGLDDKILTSWNGLMLKGLADAYAVLQDDTILQLATRNAAFISKNLSHATGQEVALYRTYKQGQAKLHAYLEDYACVINGLISLYQVSFDEQHLALAESLADYTMHHFFDAEEGFFFYTDDTASSLIARKKEVFDNVMPASNSMMARNLYKLGILLDKRDYTKQAEKMMGKMTTLMVTEPGYLTNWASLATEIVYSMAEIAIAGSELTSFSAALQQHYYPFKVITGTTTSSELPLLQGREVIDEKTTIYVCYDKACQLPVHSPEEALGQLK